MQPQKEIDVIVRLTPLIFSSLRTQTHVLSVAQYVKTAYMFCCFMVCLWLQGKFFPFYLLWLEVEASLKLFLKTKDKMIKQCWGVGQCY